MPPPLLEDFYMGGVEEGSLTISPLLVTYKFR